MKMVIVKFHTSYAYFYLERSSCLAFYFIYVTGQPREGKDWLLFLIFITLFYFLFFLKTCY